MVIRLGKRGEGMRKNACSARGIFLMGKEVYRAIRCKRCNKSLKWKQGKSGLCSNCINIENTERKKLNRHSIKRSEVKK